MFRYCAFVVILSSLVQNTCQLNNLQHEVPPCILEDGLTTGLSVQSQKDENGEWRISFSTCKAHGNSSKITRLDLKQKVKEAGEKELVQITGVLTDASDSLIYHELRFSQRGGRLAVISDDGLTAFRDNAEKEKDFATVFTSRPLKNNEMFEVKVERKIAAFPGWPIGLGVTSHFPETMEIPAYMGVLKTGTWMLYNHDFQINGNTVSKYGQGYEKLQPGDKIGVMRTRSGTLHFFVNGVDEGIAASEVPYPVYGVVDLIRNIAQVTIVNRSPNCTGK